MALPSNLTDPDIRNPSNSASPLSASVTPNNAHMHPPKPTVDEIDAVIQAATSASSHAYHAARPPRDTRTQLFVGNLPYRVRWQDLKDLFRRAGTVLRADVSLAPDNRSRGYGTVLLATAEDAGRAIDMFNGFVWQTRTLEVRHDKLGVTAMGEDFHSPAGGMGLSAGLGFGGGAVSGTSSGAGTPFPQLQTNLSGPLPRLPSATVSSPTLFSATAEDLTTLNTNLSSHLTGKLASPSSNSPRGAASPLSVHSPLLTQLTGNHTGTSLLTAQHSGSGVGLGGERSRNLFVGNLPFHIQWQDLKDLFRQAGTILRADVALGPDGRSRGFGTVSFATEADAERAVRMFNGYEFNGRQLKVHFDKFAAPSLTALPMVNSLSAPHSPHLHNGLASLHQPSPLGQFNLAQQVLLQQHRQQDHFAPGHAQDSSLSPPPVGLQRSLTDIQTFRFLHSQDELTRLASNAPLAGLDPPGVLSRAKSDTIQQLLQSQLQSQASLRPPSPSQTASEHHLQPQEEHPLHISSYRPPYAFDFSPGTPYDPYNLGRGQSIDMERYQLSFDMGAMRSENDADSQAELFPSSAYAEATGTRPSTSPSPAPAFEQQKQTHSHSQSESFASASLSAQPNASQSQTQTTPPITASPSSTPPNSIQTHPAHPGPISLPPPPPVTAFPLPPAHTLSPYHPPVSPYGPPMHHPGMMMGMMGMPTPHGLPPITPSMPPFSFLPQPSPGPSVIDSSAQKTSSASGTGEAHPQGPGNYVAHLHHAHGAILSPYTPFSPGVAMSPGVFWGQSGSGANPYINPAVGAPVHSGYFPPVPPRDQPTEYFPPFLSSSSASRPSGLANEIQIDQSSVGGGSNDDTLGATSAGRSPDSVLTSEGHTTATTTGTDVSPRPPTPSSRGTSWQTDSNGPSPMHDLTKEMASLGIQQGSVGGEKDAAPKPRPQSTGTQDEHAPSLKVAPVVRADSEPVQTASTHIPSQLSVGAKTEGERAAPLGA